MTRKKLVQVYRAVLAEIEEEEKKTKIKSWAKPLIVEKLKRLEGGGKRCPSKE